MVQQSIYIHYMYMCCWPDLHNYDSLCLVLYFYTFKDPHNKSTVSKLIQEFMVANPSFQAAHIRGILTSTNSGLWIIHFFLSLQPLHTHITEP